MGIKLDSNDDLSIGSLIVGLAEAGTFDGEGDVVRRPDNQISGVHPTDGRVAEATDNGNVYVGNGVKWVSAETALGLSASEGTISGGHAVGLPDTTAATAASLGSGWTQESADRPVWVNITVSAETDGTSDGVVTVRVDETGGTTEDYAVVCTCEGGLSGGVTDTTGTSIYLPPGAQWKIENTADPNAGNAVVTSRKAEL